MSTMMPCLPWYLTSILLFFILQKVYNSWCQLWECIQARCFSRWYHILLSSYRPCCLEMLLEQQSWQCLWSHTWMLKIMYILCCLIGWTSSVCFCFVCLSNVWINKPCLSGRSLECVRQSCASPFLVYMHMIEFFLFSLFLWVFRS
jgi:hypothetical protein